MDEGEGELADCISNAIDEMENEGGGKKKPVISDACVEEVRRDSGTGD